MEQSDKNSCIYEGCSFFRQRLVLATISGRVIKIKNIRSEEDNPGLRDYEANFIRLLDSITNGSTIVVNESGTSLFYQPGLLSGGNIEHDCNIQRSIGYYLEALVCLAPFGKKSLSAVLRGVTNDQTDPSVDMVKWSVLPVLKRFLGTDEGLELKIVKRGAAPGGGGEVMFTCPCRQKLRPLQLTDSGKVKRIRGVAVIESARSLLNKCVPDIYIYADHQKGKAAGLSVGFGLTLIAETTEGVFYGAESVSNIQGSSQGPSVPEDLGLHTAKLLMEEIYRGGCVDSASQPLAILFMALGDKDVSKVKTGPLSPYSIDMLRHLYEIFHVMFKLDVAKEDLDSNEEGMRTGASKVLLTCVGVGFKNMNKPVS